MVGTKVDVELDCKGMYCPIPIVQLKKATKVMKPGQVLRLMATDPGSVRDIPAWASKTGNRLVDTSENSGVYSFLIEVS
ncbi:hypothetical protein A3K81_02145 [Candidatus Bathyarchaeota archaeon RBG_13_60_20]|jgi:TusA-related sulfurtransferase|nr:MAG: hypothetical protein A3K81_02145 [Candidatus Bathyarchaeota archaeon RBG_13_60_20]